MIPVITNEKIDEDKFKLKWRYLIEDPLMDHDRKINLINEQIVLIDCILLEQFKSKCSTDVWITSEFYNDKNLEFLKLVFLLNELLNNARFISNKIFNRN